MISAFDEQSEEKHIASQIGERTDANIPGENMIDGHQQIY